MADRTDVERGVIIGIYQGSRVWTTGLDALLVGRARDSKAMIDATMRNRFAAPPYHQRSVQQAPILKVQDAVGARCYGRIVCHQHQRGSGVGAHALQCLQHPSP